MNTAGRKPEGWDKDPVCKKTEKMSHLCHHLFQSECHMLVLYSLTKILRGFFCPVTRGALPQAGQYSFYSLSYSVRQ